MTAPRATSLLHWTFPAMLLVGAASVATSGRDLTESFSDLQAMAEPVRLPAVIWLQRAVSLLLLISALEKIVNHFALGRRIPSPMLLVSFLLFWAGTIGAPALFGAYPKVTHELLYALTLGCACCLADPQEGDRILRAARDALVLLMLAGLLVIPLRYTLVMDPSYSAGLLAGLPRFAGLTSHPVTQGSLAQLAAMLLWAMPYRHPWVHRAAWALTLGVLFLAQSKAAWIAFVACAGAMAAVRHGGRLWRGLGNPRAGGWGVAVWSLAAVAVAASAGAMILGDAFGQLVDFLQSPQGARLASLTGRDRIWVIAAQEWESHPVFGYGLTLWDSMYRARINLPNATHAHNQFMDDAARAGTMGALALVAYAATLATLSVRHARATTGLSVALFLSLALRAVSEVPLALLGYGTELFAHLVLLVTLAAAAATRTSRQATSPSALRYGVAS